MEIDIDLGDGHALSFTAWHPDRELNPHYADLPDVEHYGAIITHKTPDGSPCEGCITFDGPVQRTLNSDRAFWTVESWSPLTLSPSLLCACGDHGFIREGKWVRA